MLTQEEYMNVVALRRQGWTIAQSRRRSRPIRPRCPRG